MANIHGKPLTWKRVGTLVKVLVVLVYYTRLEKKGGGGHSTNQIITKVIKREVNIKAKKQ